MQNIHEQTIAFIIFEGNDIFHRKEEVRLFNQLTYLPNKNSQSPAGAARYEPTPTECCLISPGITPSLSSRFLNINLLYSLISSSVISVEQPSRMFCFIKLQAFTILSISFPRYSWDGGNFSVPSIRFKIFSFDSLFPSIAVVANTPFAKYMLYNF